MSDFMRLTQSGRLMKELGVMPYWRAFRPGIPDEVVEVLLKATGRDGAIESLLDLGTGDGQVVRALFRHFHDIIAVDPVKEFLDVAEQDLCGLAAVGRRLRLVHSPAERFTVPDGWTASLVTICRAFHWMDQPLVLDRLAPVVSGAGVLAIIDDHGFWAMGSSWKDAVRDVVRDFRRTEDRPGLLGDPRPVGSYRAVLADSAFTDIEEIAIPVRRIWTTESILGYLYSSKFAARSRFGDRIDEFEAEIRRALVDHSDNDTFAEESEFSICLGRKTPF